MEEKVRLRDSQPDNYYLFLATVQKTLDRLRQFYY